MSTFGSVIKFYIHLSSYSIYSFLLDGKRKGPAGLISPASMFLALPLKVTVNVVCPTIIKVVLINETLLYVTVAAFFS